MVIKIAEEGYVGGPYFLEVTSVRASERERGREREREETKGSRIRFSRLVDTEKFGARARARGVCARVVTHTR